MDFYPYVPSTAAAAVVAALYAIGLLLTLGQIIWKRSWLWLVVALGIAAETTGYIARVVSTENVYEQTPYAIQYILIIIAPVIMAGGIYATFGRLVLWVVPPEQRTMKLLWAPPRFITPIFVGFDIVSLLLQIIGAALLATTDTSDSNASTMLSLGKDIGMAGVIVQIVAFGFFSIVTIRFHFASKKVNSTYATGNMTDAKLKKEWRSLLNAINISCLCILIRSVYREVDFTEGRNGTVSSYEWYLYVFDALPILVTVLLYTIWFPGRFVGNLGFRSGKNKRSSDIEAAKVETPPEYS